MAPRKAAIQRSFRLSQRTLDLLDALAKTVGDTRNALAERLLSEAIRTEAHPLIRFHQGALGRRRAALLDSRLYVYQVVATLRANHGDVDETAEYYGLHPRQVRAALAYYADFPDEIDEDAAAAAELEREERERWERQQRAIA